MRSLLKVWPIILVALVVVGGIFLGIFSPTESASFGAATLLFLALCFTPRGERWSFLKKSVVETLVVSAMVFSIMSGAGLFARFLMYSDITGIVLDLVTEAEFRPTTFILLIGLVFFGVLTYCGWFTFLESFKMNEFMLATVRLPWWAGKFALPFGLFFMELRYLFRFISLLATGRTGSEQEPERLANV